MTSIGTVEIQDLFVGSNAVVAAYFGADKVWEASSSDNGYTKVKYTAASGRPDWESDIVGDLHGSIRIAFGRPTISTTTQIANVRSA